jgi:hypothetical protein
MGTIEKSDIKKLANKKTLQLVDNFMTQLQAYVLAEASVHTAIRSGNDASELKRIRDDAQYSLRSLIIKAIKND